MTFPMLSLARLPERYRPLVREALRRTDYPFDQSPVIVDVLAVNIWKKYGRSVGGQFNPPHGPLEVALSTFKTVEHSVHTLAHESGHAVSAIFLTDEHKAALTEMFGAEPGTPWMDPKDPPFERLEEAFAEAFAHAYFDMPAKPSRYAYMATNSVQRGIRSLLTPSLPAKQPSELDGASLVKLVVKGREHGTQFTDVLVKPTTPRRLKFYMEYDVPLRTEIKRLRRLGAEIRKVSVGA